MRKLITVALIALFSNLLVAGTPLSKATKIEELQEKTGVVVVTGTEPIGTVTGQHYSSVKIDVKEVLNIDTGNREHGIAVTIVNNGNEISQTSSVDYDEIGALIKGLDYLSKIDRAITPLANFRADYRTNDGLRICAYSDGEVLFASIISEGTKYISASFPLASLTEIRDLIVKGKSRIDGLRKLQALVR